MKGINQFLSKIKRNRMYRFIENYNKNELSEKFKKENYNKILLINEGLYEYAYFNVAFLHNMLSLIVSAIYNGYLPFIELKNRKEGWTNWNTFFKQPFLEDLQRGKNVKINSDKTGKIEISYRLPFEKKKQKAWFKIYSDFVVFNETTNSYLQNEYTNLLKNKGKILGVITRGTDFTTLKPAGHPIQPDINDVIEFCKDKIKKYKFNYIYLASEEKTVEELFRKNFPEMVIINKRVYYDEILKENKGQYAWQIHTNRENEIYNRGIEYLSSIYLLSKCDALIGGNCGGSISALLMNGGKYEFTEIFNLGLYV